MNKVLVSIIIPIYKVENEIENCVKSILEQTYTNFELILVDDGSPDKCGEIIDKLATTDSRIRVFHKENEGAGQTREFGVKHAKGSWIMFVDGDDTIKPTALEQLLSVDNGEYDIIVGTINLNNHSIFTHKITGAINNVRYIAALLQRETKKGPVATLFKSELFKKYNIVTNSEIKQNEDLLMLINIAIHAKKIFISNDIVVYNYIYRNDSASKSASMPLSIWLLLFETIKATLKNINDDSVNLAFFRYKLFMLNVCCIGKGIFIDADNYIVSELKQESTMYSLSKKELTMLNNISDIKIQKAIYTKKRIIRNLKNMIKRCLNIRT